MDTGPETLRRLSEMRYYNRWMYEKIEPFIGQRVLEVGAGIGNLTEFLIEREFVLASDIEDKHLATLQQKFQHRENFRYMKLNIMSDDVVLRLKSFNVDTIVCLNVLEHVSDDCKALKNMFEVLVDGGNIILFVPALKWLYGTLDVNLLHHRRYTKKELLEKFSTAGFSIRHMSWMNIAGIVGWFINGRILRVPSLPPTQLHLYDKLVPLFRIFEKISGPPIGQSIIIIGHK